MARIAKEVFVQQVARNLDLPPALIAKMTEPRPAGDDRNGVWKIVRLPWPEELRECDLKGRFAMAGWRTALRAIIED